jgi:hypothetical protein
VSKFSVVAQSTNGKKQEKIGDYSCQVCDKFFNTAEKRRKHKYVAHTDKGKQRQKNAKEKHKNK